MALNHELKYFQSFIKNIKKINKRGWPGWSWSRRDPSSVLTKSLGNLLKFILDLIADSFRIVTKNKKKKEREEALKSKKATGARRKENQQGEEIKVTFIANNSCLNTSYKQSCMYINHTNMLTSIYIHILTMKRLQVVRRPSATAEPSDMMVMKLSLVMEEVRWSDDQIMIISVYDKKTNLDDDGALLCSYDLVGEIGVSSDLII